MGGDPIYGAPKAAMIYYVLSDSRTIWRSRFAMQGDVFTFGTDIEWIMYGNEIDDDQLVFAAAYDAFASGTPFRIINDNMGRDPEVNVLKNAKIAYRRGGRQFFENVQEYSWARWGLSLNVR